LAEHLASMTVSPESHFLEVGSGVGLVGIGAASFGHAVTLMEYDPHALNFPRANALANHCTDMEMISLDWNRPCLEGKFDYIVGAEVVYDEKQFDPLLKLFNTYLKPQGEVILSAEIRRSNMKFFQEMRKSFDVKIHKTTLRSDKEEIPVILCKMLKGRE
jgi:16S rRNA G1207 methylase RsmC